MTAPLRDALAEWLYEVSDDLAEDLTVPDGVALAPDDLLCAADAILDLLVEHREQVLTHLGIEQRGRMCSRHGTNCHARCGEPMVPVYALTSQGER